MSGGPLYGFAAANTINANIDLYTVLATFGLTSRIDLSVAIPIERVAINVFNQGTEYYASSGNVILTNNSKEFAEVVGGSASGIGDFVVGGKATIVERERFKLAGGLDVRFPTGDQSNFLGSGAYGVKPYVIVSQPGRFSPHASFAYQWNGPSSLYPNPNSGGTGDLNLPSSVLYEAGADVGVVPKRFSLVVDFLGERFSDALKLTSPKPANYLFCSPSSQTSAGCPAGTAPAPANQIPQTVAVATGQSYSQDNLGLGVKVSPVGRLIFTGHLLIRLDNAGLRSNVVPLVGVSYWF